MLHNIDQEWVTENVHQLYCIPLSRYTSIAVKEGVFCNDEDVNDTKTQITNNVIAVVLVRVYAGMKKRWDNIKKTNAKN